LKQVALGSSLAWNNVDAMAGLHSAEICQKKFNQLSVLVLINALKCCRLGIKSWLNKSFTACIGLLAL
jgi:hypothetical protein